LLEKGHEDSPYHPVEAHPKLLSWILSLKEIEEDVYRRWMAKVVAKDSKGSHECPAVRMQLGRGHVNLGK